MFWRLLMTDSNVLQCQKLSVSIIFMICEMITGSYLCRFDSRGIRSIPSLVMFLYSSTTLCHSLFDACGIVLNDLSGPLWCIRTFFHHHSLILLHSSYSLRYCRRSSASPLSTLFTTHFCYHHPLGLVPSMFIC